MVRGIDATGVDVAKGEETERIESSTVIWAAGVQASTLGDRLSEASEAAKDRSGRLDMTEPPDLGRLLAKINAGATTPRAASTF